MDFELTPENDGVSVTVSGQELADIIGDQGILGEDVSNREFLYLAALCLECRLSPEYDIERTIMEFIRNSSSVDITLKEANEIEGMLR